MTVPAEATREQIEGAVAEWRAVRAQRLAVEKEADAIKRCETDLKNFIVLAMQSQAYEGIVKDGRMTYVRTSQVPTASDRGAFEKYILDTGDLSLLQFRPAVGAIREQMDNGVEVPGIVMMDTFDLGDRKA